MGKVLTSIKKLKSKDADPEKQGRLFQSLAEDPNFRWQDPSHHSTMVEATRAAQRLSVYQKPPEDSAERERYLRDQEKVDEAFNTIKKHHKGNTQNIKLAVEKVMGSTSGGPSWGTTPGGPATDSNSNNQSYGVNAPMTQWTYDANHEKKSSLGDDHLYAASTQKSQISGSSSSHHNSQLHQLPSAHPDFQPQYTASHKKSESWDDDSEEEQNIIDHSPQPQVDTHRKSISSSYPLSDPEDKKIADEYKEALNPSLAQSHSPAIAPRSVVAYTAQGKQVHDIQVYNEPDANDSESITSSDTSSDSEVRRQVNNIFNNGAVPNEYATSQKPEPQDADNNFNETAPKENSAPKENGAPIAQNVDTELLQWDDAGEEEEEQVVDQNTNEVQVAVNIQRRSVSSSYAADAEEEPEDMKEDIKEEEIKEDAQPHYRLIAPVSNGANDIKISIPAEAWSVDNKQNTLNVTSPKLSPQEPKLGKKRSSNLMAPSSYSSYRGMRIQVDVLCSFHDSPWILNKDKKESQNLNHLKIKHSDRIKNVKEYHRNRRVSLTNGHNFLWFTNAVQSSQYSAEKESELTRKSLDKVLNLLPIPFRDKIWEICNPDNDTFMFQEDFAEFADALLVATGQYDMGDEDELDFEIRDMTEVFNAVVDINKIFRDKRYVSKWSKTARCLSTKGAEKVVMRARNLRNRSDLSATDDVSIAFFTGFTKRALQHAIAWCTRIFWKLLTDIWWDEDNEEDMALPMSLNKYGQNNAPRRRAKSRRNTTKMSAPQRDAMKQAMSMEVLFPDLLFDESEDEEFDPTFTQYLQIMD